jgi:deazaflavin-dependent oxidoreductase (nitroreductase family)
MSDSPESNPAGDDRPAAPDPAASPAPAGRHYKEPGWFTRNVFNRLVRTLTAAGVSVWGSRVLAVRGRRSGEWRTTPVNLLALGDDRFLVAPRGETEWVRNIRVAGGGELRLGRKVEPFAIQELDDADKPEVLRAYLRRWKAEVGVFFEGVGPDSPDTELARVAPLHPIFRVTAPAAELNDRS